MEHAKLERHGMAFALAVLGVAAIGGFVEIAPLFTIENTVEQVDGIALTPHWNWQVVTFMCARVLCLPQSNDTDAAIRCGSVRSFQPCCRKHV